jgi:acyl dehydratase
VSGGNPKLRGSDLSVGDERELLLVENLSRTQIVQYAGASGDFNPLHTDEKYATETAGYPSVFAHGMLTMGLTGRLVTDWFGDGVVKDFGVRFVRQVWPGDTLTAKGVVQSVTDGGGGMVEVALALETRNQNGEPVVTGTAVARLPG